MQVNTAKFEGFRFLPKGGRRRAQVRAMNKGREGKHFLLNPPMKGFGVAFTHPSKWNDTNLGQSSTTTASRFSSSTHDGGRFLSRARSTTCSVPLLGLLPTMKGSSGCVPNSTRCLTMDSLTSAAWTVGLGPGGPRWVPMLPQGRLRRRRLHVGNVER